MGRMDLGVSPGDSGSMAIAALWSFHGRFSYLKAPSFCQACQQGKKEGRTTSAATYQAREIEGELPLPHGDGDGFSDLQADRMGDSRTPGGDIAVSTVWRAEGSLLGGRDFGRRESAHGTDVLRLCVLEVWAGLQHKAVAVTTLAGKQTQKPLEVLGRAGKAQAQAQTRTGRIDESGSVDRAVGCSHRRRGPQDAAGTAGY
jgi:hypothetical protein